MADERSDLHRGQGGGHSRSRLPLHYGVAGNDRMKALADGVFAIAMTLLVFELQVPDQLPPGGLAAMAPQLLPKLAGDLVTFAVLGVYWIGHHNVFMHVHRHDRTLLWLNIAFLLFVAIMPFPAALIVKHGEDRLAVISYAATLVLAGLSLDLIWFHATHHRRLVSPAIDPQLVRFVHGRILLAPAVYLLAIAVSFASLTAAKVLFLIVAIAYIVPNPLDHYHHRQLQGAASDSVTADLPDTP